jgi:hypothetical protein
MWHSLPKKLPMLALFLGIILAAYLYLKKMTSLNDAGQVYLLLKYYGFDDNIAKFVTSQAAFETSGYISQLYKENNNAFGMKYAGQSLADGEKNGYANYKTLDDSVHDFSKWWIRARSALFIFPLFCNTLADYVKILKNNNYFEDTEEHYLKGCQTWYNKIFGNS